MKIAFSFLYICFLKAINSHDSESAEVNRIEITPFYDTIIVNDIADLLNEFQSTNSLFNGRIHSESESDENIEDLLSEYHNYLEKAQNQRKTYMEKSKIKNKVPLLRHDKYIKTKPTANAKYNSYYFNKLFNSSGAKFPRTVMSNHLNSLIPINSKLSKSDKDNANHIDSAGGLSVLEPFLREKTPIKGPVTIIDRGQEPIKSTCYCKNAQVSCKCLLPFDPIPFNRNDVNLLLFDNKLSEFQQDPISTKLLQNIEHVPDNVLNDSGNNINIRIKVDVQLLNASERLFKNHNRDKAFEPEINSKEMSAINLSLPYFNFPISMDMLGYQKSSSRLNKYDNIHQITIHKKKKPRFNINKKHRKKVITFHNIKVTSPVPPTTIEVNNNFTNVNDRQNLNNNETVLSNKIFKLKINNLDFGAIPANITDETAQKKDIQESNNSKLTFEQNNFTANLSNKSDVDREDSQKIENSIETEYTKTISFNVTTEFPILMGMRTKREVKNTTTPTKNMTVVEENGSTQKYVASITKVSGEKNNTRITDKIIAVDTELLYWPNIIQNKTVIGTKNITTLILEQENKNKKLNISIETIRHNHTKALEQVIFGKEVDWDDVDTVVPTFISFVGKYIRGILTLCSQNACHSIKCEEKKCMHRICDPENRLNKKGHCVGSNATDSVASMESIMDLPSNVAFEIVDILQDNMMGKLFGKVTLCISTKCCTFLASKKLFMKSKCITKNLDYIGHCPNVKSAKN